MRAVAAFAMIWLAVFTVTVAGAGVRDERPNLVGGELLGRGGIITANYERFFNNQFGVGGGIMAWAGLSDSGGLLMILPLYFSYVKGDIHGLYLSTGGTLTGEAGAVQDFPSGWAFTATAGYQYHSPQGLFVRPTFSLLKNVTENTFLIWPGVTIGGSF